MGLYNNYYFFCKSIPLSGIFIHLNLYNIMKRTIKTIFLALCYSAVTNGQTSTPIHLPAIFSDHMVLQQKSTVSIWGWGEASTTVKLVGSWMPNDTISTSVDDCGRWRTKIPTCGHGGPYTLQIFTDNRKENKIILKDILLGEVWLCSGQSNMEWSPNNGIHNRQEEIDNANHPHIRFFSLSKQGSKSPQEDCYAQWEQCTPEIMQKRSAIAYFFRQTFATETQCTHRINCFRMGRNSCRSMDSERHRHKQQSHCRSSNKQALPLVAGNTRSPLQQHDSSVNAIRHCRSHLVSRRIKQRQSVIIQFAHGKK